MESVKPRIKVLVGVGVIALFASFFSVAGALLLFLGAVLASLGLLGEWRKYVQRKRLYAQDFGAILDDDGVTFYGDWGPTIHPWSNFGEASISRLDGRPIVQHLAIRHLNLTGSERLSSYILTPVDFLDLAPDEVPARPSNSSPADIT